MCVCVYIMYMCLFILCVCMCVYTLKKSNVYIWRPRKRIEQRQYWKK